MERMPPERHNEPAGYDDDAGHDYDDGYDDRDAYDHFLDAWGDEPRRGDRRHRRPPPPQRPTNRSGNRPAGKPGKKPKGKKKRSAGRRVAGWLLALAVVAGLGAGAWFGAQKLLGDGFENYAGPGKGDVVIRVASGDTTAAIAQTLDEADVVASSQAFVAAAENNEAVRGIQPGFYQVKKQMSGSAAVEAIVAEDARVGRLEIRAGTQLRDLEGSDDKTVPGIYSLAAKATCAELNGESTCLSGKDLQAAAEKADLAALGAPEWLVAGAKDAPSQYRLEGLIMPGLYDIKPGWSAEEVLKELLTTSAAQFEAAGLPDAAKSTKLSPYEIVVIASIVEREAVESDFGKVSRVIYNRLKEPMRLQMDSTINYKLRRPQITTSDADRAKDHPYNTYRRDTLPPTPISSPSREALQAALKPVKGSWLYFVVCEKNGLSCFAKDFDTHQDNVRQAQEKGAY